uniref:Alternative protein GUCY2C n=1 Tax=Homo sapiens TaxID=9606 RepID=L0R6I0_HUMAN|nr:alternative protein GUCY2C [Homo sapiens]
MNFVRKNGPTFLLKISFLWRPMRPIMLASRSMMTKDEIQSRDYDSANTTKSE